MSGGKYIAYYATLRHKKICLASTLNPNVLYKNSSLVGMKLVAKVCTNLLICKEIRKNFQRIFDTYYKACVRVGVPYMINERYSDQELAFQIASQLSQVLPLDMLEGGGGITPFIPSSVKPLVEAYVLNRRWTGLPVYKDTPYNKSDPEWTKAYKSADQTLVEISKFINEATGGDDFKKGAIDINPAKVEYLLSGVLGGYENTVEKLKKMAETAAGQRDFEWRNMLLANRVVTSGDESTEFRKLQNEFYRYKDEADETKRLLRKYENAENEGVLGMAEKVDFLMNSDEYRRYEIYEEYKDDIDAYREMIQDSNDRYEKKDLERELYGVIKEMLARMKEK